MQAFHKIKDKFPNATLTIIGGGELEEQLTAMATQLNLGESFRLLKHLPKDNSSRAYGECRFILCR